MKIDERLETLCEEFMNLKETEKDYILEISQTLAHSVKETTTVSAGIEPGMPGYEGSKKENLA